MKTETVKIVNKEEWRLDCNYNAIWIGYPGDGRCCMYKGGEWSEVITKREIPPEVRSAAERLWQTIRPLVSGTSPDGSRWGEVRVEGEAPVRCSWERGMSRVDNIGDGYPAFSVGGFEARQWPGHAWQSAAHAWFKDHPWTGVEEGCDTCEMPEETIRRLAKENLQLRQGRDEFERRAVAAEKTNHELIICGARIEQQLAAATKRAEEAEVQVAHANRLAHKAETRLDATEYQLKLALEALRGNS